MWRTSTFHTRSWLILALSISCVRLSPNEDTNELVTAKTDTLWIDADQSIITWITKSADQTFDGTIKVTSGYFGLKEDSARFLEILLDPSQIDLVSVKDSIRRHEIQTKLRSKEYFDITAYPEIPLSIGSIKPADTSSLPRSRKSENGV